MPYPEAGIPYPVLQNNLQRSENQNDSGLSRGDKNRLFEAGALESRPLAKLDRKARPFRAACFDKETCARARKHRGLPPILRGSA